MSTALIILDMQNYFFDTPQKIASYPRLIAAINALTVACGCKDGWTIFNVVSVHKADRSTWSRSMLRSSKGSLLEGSREAQIVNDLLVGDEQILIQKTRHSAFMRTELEQKLRDRGVQRVVLCGVYTHGCVALTAIDAWSLDFEVIIATECVSSHRPDIAEFCVERLHNMFGIEFMTNAQLVEI